MEVLPGVLPIMGLIKLTNKFIIGNGERIE